MKSAAIPNPYFSAYPLKAVKETTSSPVSSPYLRSVLAGTAKTVQHVVRAINAVNAVRSSFKPVAIAKEVEISGNEWFINYE